MTHSDHSIFMPAIWEHNRAKAEEVLQCVVDRVYCTLLGPRFGGKTAILKQVQKTIHEDPAAICIYVDLSNIQAATQMGFFASLMTQIAEGVSEQTTRSYPIPSERLSSATFRDFLSRIVEQLAVDLTVMFDHLEVLPTDLIQALLTSLRALYMDQQDHESRLVAVISGALSLAAVTSGETSPFHGIARRVLVGDLREAESEALVLSHTNSADIQVSPAARSALVRATRGNPHLIKLICERSLALAAKYASKRVTAHTVGRVVNQFIRNEASEYGPLHEAIPLIEDNSDLLKCILRLLDGGDVPLRELSLPILPDLDPLYVTGMVERPREGYYRIRNDIYRMYLKDYFDPGRAGYLLTVAAQWDAAIVHLEASIVSGNEQARMDLLAATINSIYAAESVEQGAYYLMRGLSAAFQVDQIHIWLLSADGRALRLLDQMGGTIEGVLSVDPHEISLDADRIEARSYRQECVLREHQPDDMNIKYVVPLIVSGRAPVGVVTLCEVTTGDTLTSQRNRELQLQSYLSQAARALHEVDSRRKREAHLQEQGVQLEQKTDQLLLLHRISTLAQTLTDLEKICHLILTAITSHFGLGFNRAWLFLIDQDFLVGRMGIGSFTQEEAYRAWERSAHFSFEEYLIRLHQGQLEAGEIDEPTRQLRIPISEKSRDILSRTVYEPRAFHWIGTPADWSALPLEFRQLFQPAEMILTPLVVQNNCLGLIAVDNKFQPRLYSETDELLLKTFANQMATAIFTTRQHEQETKRLKLEETLRDTSRIISSSLKLTEVLHRILEEMRKVLPFDTASIQLFDEKSQRLKIIANTGFQNPKDVEKLTFPLEDGYPNVLVFKDKRPLRLADVQKDFPHFAEPQYQAAHAQGWLGAPLISNDQVIGVITLDNNTPNVYTSEHEHLAILFAGQASVAIENARLFEAESETREYLDLLIGSSQDGIIAVDHEGWVIRYSEGAERILGYSSEEVLKKKMRVDELYGDLEFARDINRRLFADERLKNYQGTILDREGQRIPIILSATLLRDKAGNHLGSVGFFKDLRPLRKVENNLRMILDTVSMMSKVDHSDAGLAALAERIVSALPVTFCQISLVDDSQQNLIIRAAYSARQHTQTDFIWNPRTGDRIALSEAILLRRLLTLTEPQVFRHGDRSEETQVVQYFQNFILLNEILRSVLVIPLQVGNEVIGLCCLGEVRDWARSPFDHEKIELISSMVTQGAVFVDRLQAHEATQSKLVMVERLRSIGEELVKSPTATPKNILYQVVEAACEVTGATKAIIYPWDKQKKTYDVNQITYFGPHTKKSFSDKTRDEEGSMTGIVLTKGIVIVDNIGRKIDRSGQIKIWEKPGGFLELEGIQAFVGIRVGSGEDPLGALFVNFLEPHYFTDGELEAITLFANQAAIAIENTRLYEDLALRLEESSTLQKVATSLTDTRDLRLVLDRVLQAAFELIHADEANILFYDVEKDEFRPDALMSSGLGLPLEAYQTRTRQRHGYTYEIIKSGKPVNVPDTAQDPHINPVTIQKGRLAAFGVPLIGRENPVGVLWMHWKTPHQISERNERLLTTIAAQAAISIENANLFDQLKAENVRQSEESRRLQEVGISLTETVDLNDVLYCVFQAALELVHADEGSILFYDESIDAFQTQALMCAGIGRPLEPYKTQVRQGVGLAYEIVKERKPIYIPDTSREPRISKVAIEKGRQATVGVPLLDFEGPVGVLWVNWKQPRQVSVKEASLLTTLASQATVAIKGAKRYAEIKRISEAYRRNSAHLQAVYEAGKVISAASVGLEKQKILDRILEQAIECVTGVAGSKASAGTIQLVDEKKRELVFRSVYPRDEGSTLTAEIGHSIALDPAQAKDGKIGITGRAATLKEAQLVADVQLDPDYLAYSPLTRSELAVPFVDEGKVLGILDVESEQLNAFDQDDKISLSRLADLAVVALKNADRAEQLARSNAVALMGAWGAEIAHDVNREVGYIRRETFLLQKRQDLPSDVKARLTIIDQSAERLALPDFSQREPRTESWLPSKISCDLIRSIYIVLNRYQNSHPHISWQFTPVVPDIQLAIHERRLLSILRHLFRNAAHALPQSEHAPAVMISATVEGSMATIEVKDTGPGIRPEIAPMLFREPIPHEDGRKGSGLLLVRFISEQYGGSIELAEDTGRGACFRVRLPIIASGRPL